jgi:hypothetical protein
LTPDPQFEDEEERHLARRRMRGDEDEAEAEDGEADAESEMLELFETAATALGGVIQAMRRRAMGEITD